MKKFMYFALSCALAVSATGCGNKAPETTTGEVGKNEQKQEETKNGEVTKLRYLAWDAGTPEDPTLERIMAEIYDETHPEVEIEVITLPEGTNYDNYIATLASSGQMADVFMWASVSEAILNGWAADVSEYALADDEYSLINPATREGGQVNGKVYGIPKGMNYMGLFMNEDLFAQNNVTPLEFGYTVDEMLTAIEKNTTSKSKGVDNFNVEAWYPFTQNPSYGFQSYDGETVHFDSEEYAKGIELAQRVTQNNWDMKNTTPVDFFGTEGWAWGEIGGIALQLEGTWNLTGLKNVADFKYDYVGLPGGHAILINDYIFVSDVSKNKEAAYDFSKWMSYSLEGITERFDIADESDYTYNAIPLITTNEEINARYFKTIEEFPGFIEAYNKISENPELLHVEGFKEVSGFRSAIFAADTGVQGKNADGTTYSMTIEQLRTAIIKGEYKLSDYTSKMNDIANLELKTAREQVEAATK
ncbi:MAG: ABC transporter substrate-binding protein [Cellulosilyticaceae bacterium]